MPDVQPQQTISIEYITDEQTEPVEESAAQETTEDYLIVTAVDNEATSPESNNVTSRIFSGTNKVLVLFSIIVAVFVFIILALVIALIIVILKKDDKLDEVPEEAEAEEDEAEEDEEDIDE